MDARKQPILVETKTFILKEALVDSDGESVWFITDSQNKNISFCVHCQFSGSIYISFFKGLHYNNDFVIEALKELLKILLEKYHIIISSKHDTACRQSSQSHLCRCVY